VRAAGWVARLEQPHEGEEAALGLLAGAAFRLATAALAVDLRELPVAVGQMERLCGVRNILNGLVGWSLNVIPSDLSVVLRKEEKTRRFSCAIRQPATLTLTWLELWGYRSRPNSPSCR
jgi:hypothetical protein